MAQPQIEVWTLKLELPFVNSHGDWRQATEDKTANKSLCLFQFCEQRPGDSLSRGSLLSLDASPW